MAPGANLRTDILISIYPKHVANIVTRQKNHEFRKYLIPSTVERIWIYETAPISAIQYCAVIDPGKQPGELAEDDLDALDNRKFNDGETLSPGGSGSRYAYKISGLYRLESSLTLEDLKRKGWAKGAPQKYNFASQEMVLELRPSLILEF
jgi:predicted transcriptional regulator